MGLLVRETGLGVDAHEPADVGGAREGVPDEVLEHGGVDALRALLRGIVVQVEPLGR